MGAFDFITDEAVRAKAEETFNKQIEEVNKSVSSKIEEAVAGLQSKNTELLSEKKSFQEKLAKFAEITDPEKALEALKFINENEDAQLIRDGKVNELIEKKTSQMRIDHETALKVLQEQLAETSNMATTYKSQFEKKMIDDSLREFAIKAGVRSEALVDVLSRGGHVFKLANDGTVEARDAKGNLLKNDEGNVVTPSVWIEGLKTGSPHYWPPSTGADARGGGYGDNSDVMTKLAEYAKAGKMKEFNELRAKMK